MFWCLYFRLFVCRVVAYTMHVYMTFLLLFVVISFFLFLFFIFHNHQSIFMHFVLFFFSFIVFNVHCIHYSLKFRKTHAGTSLWLTLISPMRKRSRWIKTNKQLHRKHNNNNHRMLIIRYRLMPSRVLEVCLNTTT